MCDFKVANLHPQHGNPNSQSVIQEMLVLLLLWGWVGPAFLVLVASGEPITKTMNPAGR